MKNKKNIVLLIVFSLLILISVAAIILFNNDDFKSNVTNKYIEKFENQTGFDFQFKNLSLNSLKDIRVGEILVLKDNSIIATADSLNIATSFNDVMRFLLGFKHFDISISLNKLYLNYQLDTGKESESGTSDFNSLLAVINRINGTFTVNNADINLAIGHNSLQVDDLRFKLSLNNGLQLKESSLYLNKITYKFNNIPIELGPLNLDFEDNNLFSLQVEKAKSVFFSSGNFSATGSYKDGTLTSSFVFNPISGSFAENFFNLSDFGLELEYDTKGQDNYLNVKFNIPAFTSLIGNNRIDMSGLNLSANIKPSFDEFILFIQTDSADAALDVSDLKKLHSDSFYSSLTFNRDGWNSISVSSDVSGYYENPYIGNFNVIFSADTLFSDFNNLLSLKNYRNLELFVNDFSCDSVSSGNQVTLWSDDGNSFKTFVSLSDKLVGNIDYSFDTNESDVRIYFSDLYFSDYKPVFELIDKYAGNYFDYDSMINGSIVYRGNVDLKDITGRASINLVGQNLLFNNEKQSAALSFEANSQNNNVTISTLAISAFGKRLSYSGTVDINKIFPEGSLVLQDLTSFDEIASIEFKLDDNNEGYSFDASASEFSNVKLKGHVNLPDGSLITANIFLCTERYDYPLDLNFDIYSRLLRIVSDGSDIDLTFDNDGTFRISGILSQLPFHVSDNVVLYADSKLDTSFNLSDSVFNIKLDDFNLVVSDILTADFDFVLDSNNINLSNLGINFKNREYHFDGDLSIKYDSLSDLLDYKNHKFEILWDMVNPNSDSIQGSFDGQIYSLYLNFLDSFRSSVSVLGTIDEGFFAECKIGEIVFNSEYKEGQLKISDGNGVYSSLVFDNIGFDIDLLNRNLFGSFDFENDKQNFDSIVKQGGRIEINAKLDSLVLGALNLAGIDAEATFNVSVLDSYLGDGFDICDNSFDVTFSRSSIRLDGSLINGFIDPVNKYFEVDINKELLFGMKAKGYFDDDFEVYLSDLYFPLQLIDQFINTPLYTTYGGIIEGNILMNGSISNPSFYGMLYSQAFNMGLLYIPDQNLSLKSVVISAEGHSFHISSTPVVGYSSIDGRYYNGLVSVDLRMNSFSLDELNLLLNVPYEPIDLWIPIILGDDSEMNIRGDVVGTLNFYFRNGKLGLDSDITASNADVTFNIENKPEWMNDLKFTLDCNVNLTSGKNVEFYYPNKINSFINFTVEEGETVDILYDCTSNSVTANGEFDIKSGRISYINNDFSITEGKFKLSENLNGDFDFSVDLLANIREYDYDGNRMEIYLRLNNANLDNINPRFSSIPSMTENEILQVLASSIIPGKNERVSLDKIANIAFITAKTAGNLGLINTNSDYSLIGVIRDSLDLDIFSAKSSILENIIVQGLSTDDTRTNLLAKYLNGTTIYAGKYIYDNFFARMTLLLRAPGHTGKLDRFGHFLTSDLNLDVELSVEWDNPIGEFSVFTKPQELSAFDFLDTIGFSVTKRFNF